MVIGKLKERKRTKFCFIERSAMGECDAWVGSPLFSSKEEELQRKRREKGRKEKTNEERWYLVEKKERGQSFVLLKDQHALIVLLTKKENCKEKEARKEKTNEERWLKERGQSLLANKISDGGM